MASSPSVDPAALDLGYLALFVGYAYAAEIQRGLEGRGFGGLRFSHGFVIQHLIGAERTIGELAARLEVTQQAASKVTSELERLGYVERVANESDARRRQVRLTQRGQAAVAAARELRRKLDARLGKRHGEAVLSRCRRELSAVLDSLGGAQAVRGRRVVLPR